MPSIKIIINASTIFACITNSLGLISALLQLATTGAAAGAAIASHLV